jgi:putative transposase
MSIRLNEAIHFTDERLIAILREQKARVLVTDLCRKHGLNSPTKFGGLDVSESAAAEG